jgi:DNA-damage-inducible protein D
MPTQSLSGPHQIFEQVKRLDEYNNEYWTARELMILLGYNRWENFAEVLKKAQ